MGALRTCLSLVFTSSLACDAGISPPDTPYPTSSSGEVDPQTLPDILVTGSPASTELNTATPTAPLDTENEFCMPFEMIACHGTTSQVLVDCQVEDCLCQLEVVNVKYAQATADCLHLACPKHYPDPSLLASCYQDWFLSIERCFKEVACADWGEACPDADSSHRLQFLRSCLGH